MLHVWLSQCKGDITVSLKQSERIQQTPKRKSPAGMMMMWVCFILRTGSRRASSTASARWRARGTCLFSEWSAVFIVPPCIKSLKNESSAFFSRSEDKVVWIWCFFLLSANPMKVSKYFCDLLTPSVALGTKHQFHSFLLKRHNI